MDAGLNDDKIFEIYANTANAIVTRLNKARRQSPVTCAIDLLLGRIVNAGNSLRVLRDHAPHEFAFDGAMILRGIYDASLQAVYILKDPISQTERAQHYLDFYWIEKEQALKRFDRSTTDLGRRMAQSPRRPLFEPLIQAEIARVRPMFQDGKLKVRDHWYKGNLRDLSKAVGLEAEYDILQAQLSGAVHASAYALKEETHVKDFLLLDWAWRFSFRVLGKFAAFAGIELSELERDLIRSCEANIFNLHGT